MSSPSPLELVIELVSELATVGNVDSLVLAVSAHLPEVLSLAEVSLTVVDPSGPKHWYSSRATPASGLDKVNFLPTSHQAPLTQALERGLSSVDDAEKTFGQPLAFGGRTFGALVISSVAPLSPADRRVLHYVADALGRALRRIEQTQLRREALEIALAENRAKDDFLSLLGHELRTPLAAIGLWGNLLRSGSMPAAQLERAVAAIMASADGMGRLVDQLLDVSRLIAGKVTLEYQVADVEALARAAVAQLQPSADAKGVLLAVAPCGALGSARLDPARFRQIIANLLSNAIRFTPAGGQVTLRLIKEGARLTITVADTGAGIPAEFMPHLFEHFRQESTRDGSSTGGLGLGLSLTRELVQLHGGKIEAESPGPDRGAIFVVHLPWLSPELEEPQAFAAASNPSTLNGVTVLLAEDDERTLLALQATFERAGARVLPAESANVALAMADEEDVADSRMVLVSDLAMPRMSGYELVVQLGIRRRNQSRRPMPACAVSAHARDSDRRRALEAGFDLFLAKPIAADELVSAVAELSQLDGV